MLEIFPGELAVLMEGVIVFAPGEADTVSAEGSRKGDALGITRGYSLSKGEANFQCFRFFCAVCFLFPTIEWLFMRLAELMVKRLDGGSRWQRVWKGEKSRWQRGQRRLAITGMVPGPRRR